MKNLYQLTFHVSIRVDLLLFHYPMVGKKGRKEPRNLAGAPSFPPEVVSFLFMIRMTYIGNDTDNDGLTDGKEIYTIYSNVNNADTDGDSIRDEIEYNR